MFYKMLVVGLLALLPSASLATAQNAYPTRYVTLIIPFAAGGSSDVIGRIVGEELGKALGQQLIFENVAGAGGSTGLARAASAKPDGYTIAIGNAGTSAAAYTIYPDLKYTAEAFVPLGLVARTASLIALKKDFAARTMPEFLALARSAPDSIRLGHAGVGSSNYLICQSFLKAIGVDVTLVSYRGAAPALNDVMGGHIDGVCDAATSLAPAIQGGQVVGLVVAGNTKIDGLPTVPTASEAGIPNFQAGGWNALFAPAGTPEPVLAKLQAALRTALATEFVRARLQGLASTVPSLDEQSPAFAQSHVAAEIARYKLLLATK
jgi:tripartite-type tricarboxylate transporter receptor subunit TctC